MNQKPRLVYDGVCNLCTSVVRFLNVLHGERLIQYVPFQILGSDVRQRYGLTEEALEGRMYLIREDGSLFSGPFAITEVCKLLTPFSFVCELFRTRVAQRLYDWIATRRYRIFGCRDSCYTVRPNQ